MTRLVAGLDIGSTRVKVLVADVDLHPCGQWHAPTPWTSGPGGTAELAPERLLAVVHALLRDVDGWLRSSQAGPAADSAEAPRITALAVAGMGETGFLVDERLQVAAPAYAWYDPRGASEMAQLPGEIAAQFCGRTGLPLGAQVSLAKLLYLRSRGVDLRGLRWLNVPEFVAVALGATPASELSLASRTGLLDQETAAPWPELLGLLAADDQLLGPLVAAGVPLGWADGPALAPSFAAAALTVAGHDHLVSAFAAGPAPASRYHVSMGTAEVVLRVHEQPLSFDERHLLATNLIDCVRHVVPGRHAVVAGTKSGLLMRRILALGGIGDAQERDQLDAAVLAAPMDPHGVRVAGARNDDGVLRIEVQTDHVGAVELFSAALQHGNLEVRRLIELVDSVLGPGTSSLVTGGWSAMQSVRQARSQVLPAASFAPPQQDTAYGAAMVAANLARATTRKDHP